MQQDADRRSVLARSAVLVGAGIVLATAAAWADEKPAGEVASVLERLQGAFESLVQESRPAVVTIRGQQRAMDAERGADSATTSWISTGGGAIVRSDGLILTTQHVLEDAVTIHVDLHDGRRYRASILAADRRADLAILRIPAANLPVLSLGDAGRLRAGHLLLALGNPLGLAADGQVAVSQGLVAAIGRPLPEGVGRQDDRYYGDMIQTTIRVGPGCSGSPLIDIHGSLVGVLAVMGNTDAGGEGFGLAIPINPRNRAVIERLMRGEQVDYGYLGVEVESLENEGAEAASRPAARGVRVSRVQAGSAGDRAGLRNGDIISTVAGAEVGSPDEFVQRVGAAGPDRLVEIGFSRHGEKRKTVAVLTRRPPPAATERAGAALTFRGAVLDEMSAAMRASGNLPASALLVVMIQDGSPAQRSGLTPGDVIIRLEGEPLTPEAACQLPKLRRDVLVGLADGGSVLIKGQ
jgi:S1-C subfamily serine protease